MFKHRTEKQQRINGPKLHREVYTNIPLIFLCVYKFLLHAFLSSYVTPVVVTTKRRNRMIDLNKSFVNFVVCIEGCFMALLADRKLYEDDNQERIQEFISKASGVSYYFLFGLYKALQSFVYKVDFEASAEMINVAKEDIYYDLNLLSCEFYDLDYKIEHLLEIIKDISIITFESLLEFMTSGAERYIPMGLRDYMKELYRLAESRESSSCFINDMACIR